MALTTWPVYSAARPESKYVSQVVLLAKGSGTNEVYMLEVDPVTGNLPVSATATITFPVYDFGASLLAPRMACVLGNTTGELAYDSGVNGAQVLRTNPATDAAHLLATRHEAAATPLSVRIGNGTNFLDMDTGASGAATPRSVLATRHEASTTPLATRLGNGTNFLTMDSGASDGATPRVVLATRHEASATPLATRQGNGTNFLTMDSGASDAATPRVVLCTRHEAAATPLAHRNSDGTNFSASFLNVTAAQQTGGAVGYSPWRATLSLGWDGTAHREVAVDTSGNIKTTTGAGRTRADGPWRNAYASVTVTTLAYTQIVASTAAAINRIQIFDSSGQTMALATGAAGFEAQIFYISPGGIDIDYHIAAGTRLSVIAISGNAVVGELDINALT
jgi:hypothetical protein